MKTVEGIRRTLQEHKEDLAQTYGVRELALFGSYVRGEATPESDLDLLVEFDNPPWFLSVP